MNQNLCTLNVLFMKCNCARHACNFAVVRVVIPDVAAMWTCCIGITDSRLSDPLSTGIEKCFDTLRFRIVWEKFQDTIYVTTGNKDN